MIRRLRSSRIAKEPGPLSPAEVEHGIRVTLIEGLIATASMTLLSGTFFDAFAIRLGVTVHQLGLLASLGPLATLLQLAVPWLLSCGRSRRPLLMTAVVFDRFLLWGVILLPFSFPRSYWVPLLLLTVFLRSMAMQIAGLTYQGWLADLIPIERRNRYWALRHTLSGPVGVVVPLFGGWVLDRWSGFTGFKALYLVVLPLLIVDILLFLFQDEPPLTPGSGGGPRQFITAFRFRPIRGYLFFFALWNLLQGATVPYTALLLYKEHRLPYTFVSILTVLSTVAALFSFAAWGRVSDRYGIRRVYRAVLPVQAAVSALWAFVGPCTYPLYIALFCLTGVLTACTRVGGFSLLLGVIPGEKRESYMAINGVVVGIAGFLAPNLGAFSLDLLKPFSLLSGVTFSALQLLFILGSLGSFLVAIAFPKFMGLDKDLKHEQTKPGGCEVDR